MNINYVRPTDKLLISMVSMVNREQTNINYNVKYIKSTKKRVITRLFGYCLPNSLLFVSLFNNGIFTKLAI